MADTNPKAGGTLDLSTGKPAPPPPPAPAPPPMPEDADPSIKAGRTLNLSKREGVARPKRAADTLGGGLAIRETLDLSTERPPPAEAPPPEPSAKRGTPKGKGKGSPTGGRDRSRGKAPASASESLADLLSPEMLAKLRGEG